ncbi:leucine-rich repeat transmembrane neuronal protein 4 isoform X1 [Aedes aegypti]|uniref:Uncharacterized protein n=2 Tax=Aedes aegypti TaxID=7159 RepID=A0A1S4EYU2_AEDAE|nr:leucine-rich repeat transmembrane neuronal protein 4 isoform X1 [Aedes aegypti]
MSDLVRMIVRLLFLICFLQLSQAQPKELKCKRESGKICQLDILTWEVSPRPVMPDLSDKHTLIIRSGNIHNFSQILTSHLGDVTKLHFGQLGIRSLYISPKWISLKAEANQIFELVIEELPDAVYEDLSFEDVNIAKARNFINRSSYEENPDDEKNEVETTTLADEPMKKQDVNELLLLNLANNKLKSIKNLKYLSKLRELLLDGNQIEFIEMETFAGMKKLKKLSLTRNEISRISTKDPTNFFALEKLSLAFNKLKILEIKNWEMVQLTQLDVSHNQLVQMDAATLDQFVSLEKLAMANNSWQCEWLDEAMKGINGAFVSLEDSQETCASEQYDVKGFCCSYFHQVEDDPVNTLDRIKRIEEANQRLKADMSKNIDSFQKDWSTKWQTLQDRAEQKMKPYREMEEKMLKDDNSKTKKAVKDFEALIDECQKLLDQIIAANAKNKEYTQKFTNLFHATLAEKNKLMSEMSKAAALEEEIKKYEVSVKAANN